MPPDGFTLLFADAALLVLDKPAGLLSVPGRGPDKQDCLANRVLAVHPDARVVHRLDMATSGLWVMALGAPAQRALNEAFAGRVVSKTYEAVVAGRITPPDSADGWAEIALPMMADWPNRPLQKISADGKPARTRWRLLGHTPEGHSRLALQPVTGRSHQLRLHLQAIGHPILGDALYAPPAVQAAAPRLLLHACRLTLPHPTHGSPLALASPVPF